MITLKLIFDRINYRIKNKFVNLDSNYVLKTILIITIMKTRDNSHSIVILPEYCHSIVIQYRNIVRILRHTAAIL